LGLFSWKEPVGMGKRRRLCPTIKGLTYWGNGKAKQEVQEDDKEIQEYNKDTKKVRQVFKDRSQQVNL